MANNGLVIGELKTRDLAEVLDIERQGYSFPWSEALFRDCFKATYRCWGAFEGDALVGYAIVAYRYDEAHLLNLCVAKSCRRHGVARKLLTFLIKAAWQDQMAQVLLEVRESNQPALDLYESEGFAILGRRKGYYPAAKAREDALVMALSSSL